MEKIKQIRLKNFPLDADSENFAKEIAGHAGVEKVALFPDSFTKEKYLKAGYKVTIPSSAAIATDQEHFYPQFRSRGINCGMMAIALPLLEEELSDKTAEKIFQAVTYPFFYYAGYRLRLPLFSRKYDLSASELDSVFSGGVKFFAASRGINEENLEAFETMALAGETNWFELKKRLNKNWLEKRTVRLRHSFGRYFGGNHFLEIQCADDINEQEAGQFALKRGQVVILLHAGGESLEDLVSTELRDKYIKTNFFSFVPKDSPEYKVFSAAHSMLMNYGYAYRLASFAIVNDAVKKILGKENECRVILDKSHNHFMKENLDSGKKIVYRHNAERLFPNEFALLSGTFNHKSYIVKGQDGLKNTLFSVDHGLGKVLDSSGKKDNNIGDIVKLYRFKNGLKYGVFLEKKETPELENESANQYFEIMAGENILKPVVSLKPLYNMKFSK